MDKIELVQAIGGEVCEGCGEDSDCGLSVDECFRIENAVQMLERYIVDAKQDGGNDG